MSAASYIGRVGGLAVALGVGTAIITGQGVANATPSPDGQDSQDGSQTGGETGTTQDNETSGLGKIEVRSLPGSPTSSDAIGHRHHARSATATSR